MQVIFTAIRHVCDTHHNTIPSRISLISAIKHVRIAQWITGGSFRFSTKTNDPLNGTFYIFKIQPDGSYKQVFPS